MSEVKILEATANEAASIQYVQSTSWACSYPNSHINKEDIQAKINEWERLGDKRIIEEMQKPGAKTWVAKNGDTVVGFIAILKSAEQTIEALHVLPEFQGKGVGSKLLNTALDFFDKDKKIIVEVVEYNESAIKFYEKYGFRKIDQSTDAIDLPTGKFIPKILMVKE